MHQSRRNALPAVRFADRHGVEPPAMTVVAGHDRANDGVLSNGYEEQFGLHAELGGNGRLGRIPRRVIREGLPLQESDTIEVARIVWN